MAWNLGRLAAVRRARALIERAESARVAVLDERARIARETHDIVAHSLAVIVRQAEGGAFVAERDPARAVQTLQTIAEATRAALTDMRGVLGVLREQEPGLSSRPTLADLAPLVAGVREAGVHAELTESGVPFTLGATTELAVYRLAQEGLTNAVKHAGPRARVEVVLSWQPEALILAVVDDGGEVPVLVPVPGTGAGLQGMRERVAAVGGTFSVAPGDRGVPGPGPVPAGDAVTGRTAVSIRVALVDDQELVRTGLAMVIDACADMRVVAQAGDGAQALDELARHTADIVLMDVQMPRMNGVDATALITARDDGPKVIVLTTFDLDDYAYAALRAGASGFLLKDASAADVIAAIRTVHSGDAVIAPSTTRRLLDHLGSGEPRRRDDAAVALLTDREREVLGEIAQGYANLEIARRLYLSEATVKTHVGRILAKLGLRDRVHVVIFAYDHGLVRRRRDHPAVGRTTILRSDAVQRLHEHAGDIRKRRPAKGNRCAPQTHVRQAAPRGTSPARPGLHRLRALCLAQDRMGVGQPRRHPRWQHAARAPHRDDRRQHRERPARFDGGRARAAAHPGLGPAGAGLAPHSPGLGRHRSAQPDRGRLPAATRRPAAGRNRGALRRTCRPPVPGRVGVHRRLHRLHRPGSRPRCALRPVCTRAGDICGEAGSQGWRGTVRRVARSEPRL
jgi:DNA-binding NarL/FixJ family response regulator/two-component sensor histidine kinase